MSKIDELYIAKSKSAPEYDKSQYYIGKISKVNFTGGIIQTENMTVLRQRLNHVDILTPNTVGYLVVIDSAEGLFLGQIIESYLNNSDVIHNAVIKEQENILHPNLKFKIIGIFSDGSFKLSGENSVGLGDKVYIANKTIIKKYVQSIQITNSQYVDANNLKFAKLNSKTGDNIDFEITADNLLDHHLMIIGSTNSGKSTSALSILDKIHDKYGKFLIIDPTGEYKDSFTNSDVDIKTIGKDLFFNTSSITDEQWVNLFHPNQNSQEVTLLEAIKKLKYKQFLLNQDTNTYIESLKKEYSGISFENIRKYLTCNRNCIDYEGCTLDEIKILQAEWNKEEIEKGIFNLKYLPDQITADSLKYKSIKKYGEWEDGYYFDTFTYGNNIWLIRKIRHYLSGYKLNDLFNTNSEVDITRILDNFINEDNSLYIGLDNNEFPSVIGDIVIDYVGNYLLSNNDSQNPFVLFIDEVHRYAKEIDEDGNYNSSLIDIAREGRKKGMFLFLTTQSPKDVPAIILNQMGTLLVHRLVGINEVAAITNFLDSNSLAKLNNLKQGEAILTGVNLIQPINLKINQVKSRKQYNQTPHIINERRKERLEIKQRARH